MNENNPKYRVKFYVICSDIQENGERFKTQKKQFLELLYQSSSESYLDTNDQQFNIEIEDVEFIDAFTPKNSEGDGYLDKPNQCEKQKGVECCTRSHLEFIRRAGKFICEDDDGSNGNETKGRRYAIVLEDDVSLLDTLEKVKIYLFKTLYMWEIKNKRLDTEGKTKIEFVSVAYHQNWLDGLPIETPKKLEQLEKTELFSLFVEETKGSAKTTSNLLDKGIHPSLYSGFRNANFTLWGAQAYIIGKDFYESFIKIFGTQSQRKTASQLNELYVERRKYADVCYAHKGITSTPGSDSILPLFFNQGFTFPAIGIEKEYEACLSSVDTEARHGYFKRYLKYLNSENLDDFKTGYTYWKDIPCECDKNI